jgi:hypothetical protein
MVGDSKAWILPSEFNVTLRAFVFLLALLPQTLLHWAWFIAIKEEEEEEDEERRIPCSSIIPITSSSQNVPGEVFMSAHRQCISKTFCCLTIFVAAAAGNTIKQRDDSSLFYVGEGRNKHPD